MAVYSNIMNDNANLLMGDPFRDVVAGRLRSAGVVYALLGAGSLKNKKCYDIWKHLKHIKLVLNKWKD